MDFRLKLSSTLQDDKLALDRLSSLPVELLVRILSLLPTKDAAVTCALSRTINRAFLWITSLDFSDAPVSTCLEHPYAIQRFPMFVSFVDTVLNAHQSQCLTSFRLHLGKDFANTHYLIAKHKPNGCVKGCFPDLKSMQVNAWISFAITRIGLKELDLRIRVREPGELPTAIFMCETLEVLKLDVNLGLDQAYTMPSFRLPNLKLLHLYAAVINEDGFLPKLISSCPLLEDLTVEAFWNHVNYIHISSPSLRRLRLVMEKLDTYGNTDYVLIDTPNLEYLYYSDNVPVQHSITNMNRLVEAQIIFGNTIMDYVPPPLDEVEDLDLQVLLSLIKVLNNVQQLSLHGVCLEELNVHGIENELPMFYNLKNLELGLADQNCWDNVLLAFLNHSPVLETLVFPEGLIAFSNVEVCPRPDDSDEEGTLEEEQEFFRETLTVIPSCCQYHLKRIVIDHYFGQEREINVIQFLLRHSFVLEELIIRKGYYPTADDMALETALQSLPRASATCSIRVQNKKTASSQKAESRDVSGASQVGDPPHL